MNKLFLIIMFLLFFINGHTQDKWFSTVELDFIVPNEIEYSYFLEHYTSSHIESKTSFALQYAINYKLFDKLSVGALTGIQQQYGANFFMYKIGTNVKYYFVDSDNVYTYLQYAGNFTVDKNKFKNGNNLRLGIGFPVMKRNSFNLNLNIFYDINHFNLSGSKPLMFGNETPKSIFFRSYGISFGIKF